MSNMLVGYAEPLHFNNCNLDFQDRAGSQLGWWDFHESLRLDNLNLHFEATPWCIVEADSKIDV